MIKMKVFKNKKGKAVFYVGAGTLCLFLLVLFVFISLFDPTLGQEITTTITNLAIAIKGG